MSVYEMYLFSFLYRRFGIFIQIGTAILIVVALAAAIGIPFYFAQETARASGDVTTYTTQTTTTITTATTETTSESLSH